METIGPTLSPTELYQELKRVAPIDHWQSDLYCKVTTQSQALVERYRYESMVTVFESNDHTLWYDIPFAYTPYWEEKYD